MRTSMAAVTVTAVLALVASGCSRSGEGGDARDGKPAVAVDVMRVQPATLTQAIDVVGTLEPKYAADVKSEFTSVVTDVYVTEWVHVDKGAPLARLDTRDAEAGRRAAAAVALQANVAATQAERELARAVKLKEHGLITQQSLDDARSAAEAAGAAAQAAAAELAAAETRLAKAIIRAPMAGTVALRSVSVGDRVENMGSGDPMFRIVDNRVLDLTVSVPSARSAALAPGQRLEFSVAAYPGKTFTGRVAQINPTADAASRTVRVRVEVPNADGELRGGTFVKGRIETGVRNGVLQVPLAALLTWDVDHATAEVLVVEGDTARRRTVRTGETTADSVEVVDGLAAGDRVVVRGGFNVRSGDRVLVSSPQGA